MRCAILQKEDKSEWVPPKTLDLSAYGSRIPVGALPQRIASASSIGSIVWIPREARQQAEAVWVYPSCARWLRHMGVQFRQGCRKTVAPNSTLRCHWPPDRRPHLAQMG